MPLAEVSAIQPANSTKKYNDVPMTMPRERRSSAGAWTTASKIPDFDNEPPRCRASITRRIRCGISQHNGADKIS